MEGERELETEKAIHDGTTVSTWNQRSDKQDQVWKEKILVLKMDGSKAERHPSSVQEMDKRKKFVQEEEIDLFWSKRMKLRCFQIKFMCFKVIR